MNAIIFGDNFIPAGIHRVGIARTTGAHRVATLLRKKGIDTEVVDFFLSFSLDEIFQILSLYNEDLKFIGFSASITYYPKGKIDSVVQFVRKNLPWAKIIVGGTNVYAKDAPGADLYIEGFVEEAIDDIVKFVEGQSHSMQAESFNGKPTVKVTHTYPLVNNQKLETIYIPSDFISPNETLVLEYSRGCIFKCKFCDFPLIGKNKNDYLREDEDILKELIRNYNQWGTTHYIISDDTFNDNELKVDSLLRISKQLPFKLSIMGFIRADLMHARGTTVDKLVEAGFKAMHFGIETFHPEASKLIGKAFSGSKMKEYLTGVKQKHPNLFLHSSFIVGLPYEDEQCLEDTFNWCDTSMVLDAWSTYPLNIPAKSGMVLTSYFADNWRLYGYKKIEEDDIRIIWENKHFNTYTSEKLSAELNAKKYNNKKINPWSAFSITAHGYDIDQLLKENKNNLDIPDLINKTAKFVDVYKYKKLEFFKTKFNLQK
jgi:radical SAM superfamily enzyme